MAGSRRFDRLRTWLARLASFYVVMLVVAAGLGHVFLELGEVGVRPDVRAFNVAVLTWLHGLASPLGDQLALALAFIGGDVGILLVGAACAAWLWSRGRVIDLVTLGANLGGCAALTWGLKKWFQLPRPALFPHLVEELAYSFPSGHASMSMALYACIGGWLVAQAPREAWRWLVAVACVAFVAAIGASRLYLGVHWPTDVAGGYTIALAWLALCLAGRRWLAARYGVPQTSTSSEMSSAGAEWVSPPTEM